MVTIIAALLLSFLVLIHEIGHFLAAKWAKVHVEEFGLGYPPKALKLFKKWGTKFTLNWIPFGGFIRMEGEEGVVEGKKTSKGDAFYEKSTFKRLVIILAGATINFLFGIIAFTIVYSFTGIPTIWNEPRITAVQKDTPAAVAQLPTGVNITAIKFDGYETPITTREEAVNRIKELGGKTITLVTTGPCEMFVCEDTRHEFVVEARTVEDTPQNEGSIGIMFQVAYPKFYPWYEMPLRGAVVGVEQAVGLSLFIANIFVQAVGEGITQGKLPAAFMSPVGIVDEIGQSGVIQEGFLAVLHLAGMISVNLAILNVMPIPALDGGRAAFILLSKVFNKQWVEKIESYVNYGAMIVLLLLLVTLAFRDIYTIYVR